MVALQVIVRRHQTIRRGIALCVSRCASWLPPDIGPRSIRKAAAQVVSRAGCGLAQTCIPRRGAQTGVTRNDLSQPLYTGMWRS